MSTRSPGTHPVRPALSADDPQEIGGYRLHARLGSGGMGVVYLAHTRGGRPIALKVVREDFAADPGFRLRFADEVASARRIHGLFTAQVIDSGVDDPVPWLATAYVPGPSLAQAVQRHGPLPPRTVLLLVAGIAEALQAIHGAGVVHRDLKPANVLIAEDGPRVIDFGIARAADATGLTAAGLRIGTAAYMAPEQAMGLPVTPAADVFALGALAVYVAGGMPPFGSGPESATLYRVVHEPPDLSRVPPDLRDLFVGCLAKQPGLRPAPDDIIAAVHAHARVAPSLEFTHGWLPPGLRGEIGPGGEHGPPSPVHMAPTQGGPTPTRARPDPEAYIRPAPEAYLVRAPDFPGGTEGGAAEPGAGDRGAGVPRDRRRPRGRRWARGVLVGAAVAVVLVAAAAALHLPDRPGRAGAHTPDAPRRTGQQTPVPDPPTSAAASPSPSARYAPAYADAELTAPDESYEFDLQAGEVVPAETSSWYLARSGEEFVPPEDTDAFVAAGYVLSPADCERGLATEPVTGLSFDDLADERPFCVRRSDGREIVIVRLVHAEAEGGPVTVVLSRYTREG
ncbi:serine/threonine protein kinase [Streptomyces anulatus]|uniref:serine/threonine-protein kinase n=1 Tax=Streptomyces TaxID=1883 RepID=UPI000BFC6D21|nr:MULTISPECIES: serine/threonine-protein kinase [unclassified Streptomyces]MBT1104320.1 serine/threonine protein kinase [Streptomyces sp. Tu10]